MPVVHNNENSPSSQRGNIIFVYIFDFIRMPRDTIPNSSPGGLWCQVHARVHFLVMLFHSSLQRKALLSCYCTVATRHVYTWHCFVNQNVWLNQQQPAQHQDLAYGFHISVLQDGLVSTAQLIPERKELKHHNNKLLSGKLWGLFTYTHLVHANLWSACWTLCKTHTGFSSTGLGEGACKRFILLKLQDRIIIFHCVRPG